MRSLSATASAFRRQQVALVGCSRLATLLLPPGQATRSSATAQNCATEDRQASAGRLRRDARSAPHCRSQLIFALADSARSSKRCAKVGEGLRPLGDDWLGPRAVSKPRKRPDQPLSLKLSGAVLRNRAAGATSAFLESDRPDGPRADDAYGDAGVVRPGPPPAWRRLLLLVRNRQRDRRTTCCCCSACNIRGFCQHERIEHGGRAFASICARIRPSGARLVGPLCRPRDQGKAPRSSPWGAPSGPRAERPRC
jgi:hypothetical protein